MKKTDLQQSAEYFRVTSIDPKIITALSQSNQRKNKFNLPKITAPPEQISEMFGIPVGVLANWRWMGRGPRYFKTKRRVYYFIDDVITYLQQNPVLTIDSLHEERKD